MLLSSFVRSVTATIVLNMFPDDNVFITFILATWPVCFALYIIGIFPPYFLLKVYMYFFRKEKHDVVSV